MEIDGVQTCNVCLKSSHDDANTVFIKAVAKGEEIHVCTGCIPVIIHGDGSAVKNNEQVRLETNK
jgi:hypothetical protein